MGEVIHKTVRLTEQDIANLSATPVELVPAVEGFRIVIHDYYRIDSENIHVEYELTAAEKE
jgi:hypothetical protein